MQNKLFKPYAVLPLAVIAAFSMTACSKKDQSPSAAAPTSQSTAAPQNAPQSASSPSSATNTSLPQPDANYPLANYINLTSGNQLMFLYYALSGMPPDYSKIAGLYSKDYRSTSDTFKQQDILKTLTPQIDASIAAAKSQRYLIWTEDYSPVGHYDFGKKAFPLNSPYLQNATATGYFNDNNGYQIKFGNGADFAVMPVPDENQAKEIENRVSKSQPFKVKIYCFAQNTDPSNDSVNTVITRVELLTEDGAVLASYPAK